ncbi:MAG TPA: PIN domain-containing protein [Candidatus Acidoferrales bacterium]|nr:PIN domain-containing protein [Candidatus Acidoferrales bacterium]
MNDETRLIDTNVLVQAYTVSDDRKHGVALPMVERIWEGEGATTTLQNLCEFFFVVTRKVARPISATAAETIVRGILGASQWRVIDRRTETVLKAMELVRQRRVPFWDALVAACMLENGISTIITENEADFKRIPGITVTNPFKTARGK